MVCQCFVLYCINVISIIAILIAVLLPATQRRRGAKPIQARRESKNALACSD